MTIPLRTPAGTFATILRCLTWAVAKQTGWGLPGPLIALITDRLRRIGQKFAEIADRIAAGSTYLPRPAAIPRRRPGQKPPPPDPLPNKIGWLLPLVADAVGYRCQLEKLLREPEMAALLEAAPGPMRRPLRSLCRMLAIKPPPILALPQKPRPPRQPRAARPTLPPQRPTPPEAPAWMHFQRTPWTLSRICGRRGPR